MDPLIKKTEGEQDSSFSSPSFLQTLDREVRSKSPFLGKRLDVRNRKGRILVTKHSECLEQKRTDVCYHIVYSILFYSIVFYKNNHKITNNYTSFVYIFYMS